MDTEPDFYDGDERIRFTAAVNGNPVIIDVERETIEDHLGSPGMVAADRLDFVRRNRAQIVTHVTDYLRVAPDVTGMIVGADQLKHCR